MYILFSVVVSVTIERKFLLLLLFLVRRLDVGNSMLLFIRLWISVTADVVATFGVQTA